MFFFTVLAGLVVGSFTGRRLSEYLMVLYYHHDLTDNKKFLDLYDTVDDEFHYYMYSGTVKHPPKKYADYLRLHQNFRAKAHNIYLYYLRELKIYVLKYIALVVVVPTALLFFTTWYAYLAIYFFIMVSFVIYKRYVKKYDSEFHAILLVSLVFNYKKK